MEAQSLEEFYPERTTWEMQWTASSFVQHVVWTALGCEILPFASLRISKNHRNLDEGTDLPPIQSPYFEYTEANSILCYTCILTHLYVTCDYIKAGKSKEPKISSVKCYLKAKTGFHCCNELRLRLFSTQWNFCAPSIQIKGHTVV